MTTATSLAAPLILSQDYELFFHDSGSISHCLVEPSELLCAFARQHSASITFYVDAGMVSRMRELSQAHPAVSKMHDEVRAHIEQLARLGHDIALHVHPHWEDTHWRDDRWDFGGARYRLDEFTQEEATAIVKKYAGVLSDLTTEPLSSYRAGGFCIEPFEYVGAALSELGIDVDSSVVPGAVLRDADKGFDFSRAPGSPWWQFDDSPLKPTSDGAFLEIPVTPMKLPFFHYWQRLFARLAKSAPGVASGGEGVSKRLGATEVVRRLLGGGRVSESSSDGPKAAQLMQHGAHDTQRVLWQVMGHPKLLTPTALTHLNAFIVKHQIQNVTSVAQVAKDIRSGALTS
ncbi:MAG: hypothetical protein AAF004_07925 [Pseudomonadota bacterium]